MKARTAILVRIGIIAALYTVLTLITIPIAFGPIQVRISEALTLLPLVMPEAIPALFLGCILSNIISAYGVFDIVFGSLATLLAGFLTFLIGRVFRFYKKNEITLENKKKAYTTMFFRYFLGGLPPVLINAIVIPLIIYFVSTPEGYWINFASILATQAIWVYALGIPMILVLEKRFGDKLKISKK